MEELAATIRRIKPSREGFELLKDQDPGTEFLSWVDELIDIHGEEWQMDHEFLGFIKDYYHISQLLSGYHADKLTIVDVGCGAALQHVFFKDFKRYIAIDHEFAHVKLFTDNAEFINKEFSDLLTYEELIIEPELTIGIANMSLLYNPRLDVIWEFNNFFMRKIIL